MRHPRSLQERVKDKPSVRAVVGALIVCSLLNGCACVPEMKETPTHQNDQDEIPNIDLLTSYSRHMSQ
jgi:hypothetical protein